MDPKTIQSESAATLLAESELEYDRLVKRRQADELLYEPNPADLHVWEVAVYETWESTGSTTRKEYTIQCLTEGVAYEWAAYRLRERQVFGQSWQGPHTQLMQDMFDAGQYKELVEHCAQRYSAVSFKVRMSPILASGTPREIIPLECPDAD